MAARGGGQAHPDDLVPAHKVRLPGLPRNAVSRPRLDRLMETLLEEHPALCIVAAAGSGKTVQAQLFAHAWGEPVAWLTLDRRDTSPSRLLSALAVAMSPVVTAACEIVGDALQSGFDHEEVAVLLADAVGAHELLLVVDQCDQIGGGDAQRVLAAFVGHAPAGIHAVLLSRDEFDPGFAPLIDQGRVARISDDDLQLAADEAAALLASRRHDVAVEAALEATGGWVAGVAFWPGPGSSASRSEMHAYLGAELLDRLAEPEQRFLLDTSILNEVTRPSASAICGYDVSAVWDQLGSRHLPATTSTAGTFVYQPIFRSFLQGELQVRDPGRVQELYRSYAAHLMSVGQVEEATECYLSGGDLDAAIGSAEQCLDRLYQRADWPMLLRWCTAMGEARIRRQPRLLAAYLQALHGTRRFDMTRRIVRETERLGLFRVATEAEPRLLASMAWAMQDEPAEALRLLDSYTGDARTEAVRFMIAATSQIDPAAPPRRVASADLGRQVTWGLLIQGRLSAVIGSVDPPGDGSIVDTNLLLALALRGDLEDAWHLWDQVPDQMRGRAQTWFVRAWLLLAEGDSDGALAAVEAALTESRESGFGFYPVYRVFCARVLLSLGQAEEAGVLLEELMPTIEAQGNRYLVEWGQVLIGLKFLLGDQPEEAATALREAVRSMRRAERLLFLPMACVYLSDAEARLDRPGVAHELATTALDVTDTTGARRWLAVALRDVPDVVDRELAADASDPRWRALIADDAVVTRVHRRPGRARSIDLQPFGPHPDIFVDGAPLAVHRFKVIELVAYLVLHPDGVDRHELQRNLFPGVDQRRGGNHFRQIAHKLHQLTGIRLARAAEGEVIWPEDAALDSLDGRLERTISGAQSLEGPDRLAELRLVLDEIPGPYLERSVLAWAEHRRYQLEVVREEALLEITRLCAELGDSVAAHQSAESLLKLNPLCIEAYRYLQEPGAGPGSAAIYRRAVQALEDMALSKSEIDEITRGLRSSAAEGRRA
jgi:tetratricopeptide (TPR) repeat protein